MNHPEVALMTMRIERELERRELLARSRLHWNCPTEPAPTTRPQPGFLRCSWLEANGALRGRWWWSLLSPRADDAPPMAA